LTTNFTSRAIADQLEGLSSQLRGLTVISIPVLGFKELRKVAADHIRSNPLEYLPFLDVNPAEAEADPALAVAGYCRAVAETAEWGGQVEIKAIASSLQIPISVYSADSPLLTVGEEFKQEQLTKLHKVLPEAAAAQSIADIRITFHKCYYALGEHYNSTQRLTP
jgi:OTU domain-containing protein 6